MASATHLFTLSVRLEGKAVRVLRSRARAEGGRAVLLLHGAGLAGRSWELQLLAFARAEIDALAPDLPGHGGSEGPPRTRISEMAAWTVALTDALGLRSVVLAGHSMGALVALETAALLGRRLAGLALIGASAEMPVNPALLAAAHEDLPKAASMIAGWSYGPEAQADGRAEAGRRAIACSGAGVLAADLDACAAYGDAARAAAGIACPALVVAGARDRMTPSGRGRALAEAIGAEFIELPEIGHMPMAEAPAELSKTLLRLAG